MISHYDDSLFSILFVMYSTSLMYLVDNF
jgi:hypothetical protein